MPSNVKRETSADCRAQTIRVIAKWAHEAGNPKNEGLTLAFDVLNGVRPIEKAGSNVAVGPMTYLT